MLLDAWAVLAAHYRVELVGYAPGGNPRSTG